ncbi:hypothetical protein P171DRAFT_470586 [Karstenula rhodostoma CBS 690.94]|uniref:Uncharacterized protein n=1 Tax=Karstenula rhodostoma CBS 690.94 TaxID=1392251 RepID=A0A9P4UGW4_9PLEO|nr:hypothetical protein P171DRAFT_470586 [Karstenula rhodostoma CBS 690.94]
MASSTVDQAWQTRTLVGIAAVAVAIGVAYSVWGSDFSPSAVSKSKSATSQTPRKRHFELKGNPKSWSEDDMKKYLTTRDMGVGHDPSIEELRAMVLSKMNEPKATGLDDPREWSDQDMRDFLKKNNLTHGDAGRMELLAMVESKLHEPEV